MTVLSSDDAFREGQRTVNDRCRQAGIAPLSGHDIAIIAAHAAFSKGYASVLSRLQEGQEEQFNRDAVTFAAQCIARAILA